MQFVLLLDFRVPSFCQSDISGKMTTSPKQNLVVFQKYELSSVGTITHRVISDRVHRLLVTLSYFRPDRFVQLLSLIPILILLLLLLVSGCLTSLC